MIGFPLRALGFGSSRGLWLRVQDSYGSGSGLLCGLCLGLEGRRFLQAGCVANFFRK